MTGSSCELEERLNDTCCSGMLGEISLEEFCRAMNSGAFLELMIRICFDVMVILPSSRKILLQNENELVLR